MDKNTVAIICPNSSCRSLLRIPEKALGTKIRCGECGMVFRAPAPPPPEKDNKDDKDDNSGDK